MTAIDPSYETCRATILRAGIGKIDFFDPIHYVWIAFAPIDAHGPTPPHRIRSLPRILEWRGWLTDGGAPDLITTLMACGARMLDGDPTDLEGLTKEELTLHLATLECIEAPGSTRTFVISVSKPDQADQAGRITRSEPREASKT
jgi:hypothetical protein